MGVTLRNLEYLVDRINQETGSPMTPYTQGADGKFYANIGNYHLDSAYGGYKLNRMFNKGGGVSSPLGLGFFTKREIYPILAAFLAGIETGIKV